MCRESLAPNIHQLQAGRRKDAPTNSLDGAFFGVRIVATFNCQPCRFRRAKKASAVMAQCDRECPWHDPARGRICQRQ